MAKKSKKKSSSLKVNFQGVEGKRKLLPEDDYKVEVEEVERRDGDKAEYLAFTFVVTEGEHTGAKLWDNASLSEKALWRLRSLLECLGVEIDDEDEMDIDLEDLVGRSMTAVVSHEKDPDYGKKARITDFYGDEEDEKPKSKKPSKKSSKSDDDDGDEDDEEDRKKKRRAERRKARKERGGKDDDGDEDEEEEEPKSKKSSKKDKGKKAKKFSADDVQDADEDGLEEIIEKSGVEVDLDDYKTLKKKQAAVIDALEDAELLDE